MLIRTKTLDSGFVYKYNIWHSIVQKYFFRQAKKFFPEILMFFHRCSRLNGAPRKVTKMLDAAMGEHRQLIRSIGEFIESPKDINFRIHFLSVLRRFVRLTYNLPASEHSRNHHNESFGLLRHSLETAHQALRL
jgi:hypothetical protein